MIKSVRVLSQTEAEALKPSKDTAVISIISPNSPAAKLDETKFHSVKREWFHDIDKYIYLRSETGRVSPVHPITGDQALEIIRYIETIKADPNHLHLVVHCEAGVSRSVAIAIFIRDQYNVPLKVDRDLQFYNRKVLRTLEKQYQEYINYEAVFK